MQVVEIVGVQEVRRPLGRPVHAKVAAVALNPKVRIGKRRVRLDGDRVILEMRVVGDESTASWRGRLGSPRWQ